MKKVVLASCLILLLLSLLLAACGDENNTAAPTNAKQSPTADNPPTATPLPLDPTQLKPSFQRFAYYIPGDKNSLESLKANCKTLDYVSPFYFYIEADGRVSGIDESSTTALLKSTGLRIVPLIQNKTQGDDFAKIIGNPDLTNQIIAKLVDITDKLGYDGIHIDFEGLNGTDRNNLTDFMRRLAVAFKPKNKLVTMAVAAKQGDIGNRNSEAFDYGGLAPYVDLVNVMAYDYSYQWGKAGPVAPIEWVASVARYAVSRFGARKVLLGIPLYGYEWNTVTGKFMTSRTYSQIMDLVVANAGNFYYNDEYKTPYAEYKDINGDMRRVWYEDSRSWAAKLELADKLKLAGYAAWRLGQEGPDFWEQTAKYTPVTARKAPAPNTTVYFRTTGQTVSDFFKLTFEKNGGENRFGPPLTGELDEVMNGKTRKVQYFEKARLEYYPEFKGTANEIQIGALGRLLTQGRDKEKGFLTAQAIQDNANTRYFKETGHSLSLGFRTFWENNGGLYLFGYPISEEFQETSPFDGRVYTVQYFERARLEFDPISKSVRQGALGSQYLWQIRGWLR